MRRESHHYLDWWLIMLNWLVSRIRQGEVDHCLGSDRAIDAYLATFSATDPQHTLAALEEWIEDPALLSTELPAPLALHALARLDDFAQISVDACWVRYFQEGSQNYLSASLLKHLQTHYANLAGAYRHALTLAAVPENGEDRLKTRNSLARIATRAMAALAEHKKISHFAYLGPDANWWQQAHDLLVLARSHGILHIKQALHPGDVEPTSVWREYLIALQFETAPLSTLSRPQMAVLDRLVRAIEASFLCTDSFSPQTPFRIRIDQACGPSRCVPGQDEHPAWRYFGPGRARAQLMHIKAATSTRRPPEWLPPFCKTKDCLALLDQLIQHWSINPPQRQKKRHQQKCMLRVVSGFPLIRRMVSASEFARSGRTLDYDTHLQQKEQQRRISLLGIYSEPEPIAVQTPQETLARMETAGDRQMTERWELIDLSERGLGTRCEHRRAWQEIGALIGYRFEDEIDWRVGVIRRLGRSHGKPNAGLSSFGENPRSGQLDLGKGNSCPWQQQTRDTSGHGFIDAILLSRDEKLLLMPRGVYSPELRADLLLGGSRIPLLLTGIEASGSDYDLVLFREADAAVAPANP